MIAPLDDASITGLSASELAAAVAAGSISARDAVEAHIARIEAVNPALNAVVETCFEEARGAADRADGLRRSGAPLGPLHGVPITIKEQFAVAGMTTTIGVKPPLRDEMDGPLVARLRDAGAIVLGKTNVPQLLIYNESDNPVYGRTNNPYGRDRSCGGSSGGEAAVIAAHGSALGLGSDVGGSLRTPAHACGIASLKPTAGRLTNEDARPGGYAHGQIAILSQPGPMARRARDLALAMRVLAAPGQERLDPSIAPVPWREPDGVDVASLRVAYYEDDGFFPAAPSVRRAVREAVALLAARGARVERFTPPDVTGAMTTYFGIMAADGARSAARRLGTGERDRRVRGLFQLVAIPALARPFARAAATLALQKHFAHQIGAIRPSSTDGYWSLVEAQADYRRRFVAELDRGGFDAIVCPPHALPALRHGSSYWLTGAASYAMLYNLLGMPAGVVPVTAVAPDEQRYDAPAYDVVLRAARDVVRGSAGLPLGVQVVARHWREDVALAVMIALDEGRPEKR